MINRVLVFLYRMKDRLGLNGDEVGKWFYLLFKNALKRKYLVSETEEHWIFRFNGRSIALRRNDLADISVFWQVIDRRIYDFPLKLRRSPKHVVDCGANIGLSAVYFADKFADAKVYGFEIDRDNFSLLKKNAEPFGKRIVPTNAGVYKEDGRLFFQKGDYNYSHKLATSGTRTIDTLSVGTITEKFRIDFIDILKIDIEGGEYELTDNLDRFLPKVGCLMIEFEDPHKNKPKVDAFKQKLHKNNFTYFGSRLNVDCYIRP